MQIKLFLLKEIKRSKIAMDIPQRRRKPFLKRKTDFIFQAFRYCLTEAVEFGENKLNPRI